jgi:predicted N-formylglutamate amidohydrolase
VVSSRQALLADDDPAPFRVLNDGARSPYLVICDHAGRKFPSALGTLGLPEPELTRHIAWDIGVAGLAEQLGRALDAWVILQEYSRLVIDCNRPLTSPESIVQRSEYTVIPGNLAISAEQAQLRAQCIFEPYHARIRRELTLRGARGGEATTLIFLHSFTPEFKAVKSQWHAGVLYHRDTRLALPLLHALRAEPGLLVGDNEPYAASEATDYGLIEHAEKRGLPYVELEVRQDLLSDADGQRTWALRLARLLAGVPMVRTDGKGSGA